MTAVDDGVASVVIDDTLRLEVDERIEPLQSMIEEVGYAPPWTREDSCRLT